MGCETVRAPEGNIAILCLRGRARAPLCAVCRRRPAARLCDWPLGEGRTCDRPLCERCAVRPATVSSLRLDDTVDYCPHHLGPGEAA